MHLFPFLSEALGNQLRIVADSSWLRRIFRRDDMPLYSMHVTLRCNGFRRHYLPSASVRPNRLFSRGPWPARCRLARRWLAGSRSCLARKSPEALYPFGML